MIPYYINIHIYTYIYTWIYTYTYILTYIYMCIHIDPPTHPHPHPLISTQTHQAVSDRKGPKERWLTVCDTSMVSQLNWWLSEDACTLSIPCVAKVLLRCCLLTHGWTLQPSPSSLSTAKQNFSSRTPRYIIRKNM